MPPTMEPEDWLQIVDTYKARKASATRTSYACQWRKWLAFCEFKEYPPFAAHPAHVASYLVKLDQMGYAVGTLEVVVAALRDAYLSRGKDDPTAARVVRNTLGGIRQRRKEAGHPGPRQARGLTAKDFGKIRAAPRVTPLTVALIGVMRDGLLRQGEAVKLTWGDVVFLEDGGAHIEIRGSKTTGRTVPQYIRPGATKLLKAIRPEGAKPTDSVFGMRRAEYVSRRIKRAAKNAGLGAGFSGHSCRVGMAQDLSAAGFDLIQIMQAGRWKSPRIVARYVENLEIRRGAVANLPEIE